MITDAEHPERLAVLLYCKGKGADIGCGHRKTVSEAIGVDIVPKGELGTVGAVEGKVSEADITADGSALPFEDKTLDYIVARHNLEHYVDVVKTLQEWKRVLKEGGFLVLVLPDEEKLDTIRLDPSHKHVFTQESMDRLIEVVGGFCKVRTEVVIPNWSFIGIYRRSNES